MWFHNISRSLTDKLNSLWKLAEAYQPTENEIKQFADQISNSWTCVNRQVILLLKYIFLLSKFYIFTSFNLIYFNFKITKFC